MELRKYTHFLLAVLLFAGCSQADKSDAYGQFEAEETIISAQNSGILLHLNVEEGAEIDAGMQVGLIDTTQFYLRKKELFAMGKSIQAGIKKLDAQRLVLDEKLATTRKEMERISMLLQQNAATQQQLDAAEGQVNVLEKQIAAIDVEKQAVFAELDVLQSRIQQADEQLEKSRIINPVRGTVLQKLANEHELVTPGKPLYSIANLDELILRVYVAGGQLPQLALAQQVQVLVDKNAEEFIAFDGIVQWISPKAEFTPKMIQTKSERVTQVYAVKIAVQNRDGLLKIGMPGEVNFMELSATRTEK